MAVEELGERGGSPAAARAHQGAVLEVALDGLTQRVNGVVGFMLSATSAGTVRPDGSSDTASCRTVRVRLSL